MFTFVEIGHLCPLCNIDHNKLRYQDRAHCAFFHCATPRNYSTQAKRVCR